VKKSDAFWEKRNTGFKTCELVFNIADSIDEYRKSSVEEEYEYILAKVPTGNIILVQQLEEIGFRFLETQFTISVSSLELGKFDKKWNRVLDGTSSEKIDNRNDLDFLLTNISDGMFTEDRISIDDKLGPKISSRRYTNWIEDIYKENTAEIFILKRNSQKVGFFIMKSISTNAFQSVIAGIFKPFQGYGLSISLIYHYLKIATERNGKKVFTSFSSNNQKMLNTFTRSVFFKAVEIHYVLRKIIPG